MDKSVSGGGTSSTVAKREGESTGRVQIFSHIYGLIVKEAEHLKIQLKWIELKVLPKNLVFIYMLTVDWKERKVKAEKYRQERLRHERNTSSMKLYMGCSFISWEIREIPFLSEWKISCRFLRKVVCCPGPKSVLGTWLDIPVCVPFPPYAGDQDIPASLEVTGTIYM